MGAIEAIDTGSRPRVLAELMGAQVAWWQLGFTTRRAVLGAARRGSRFPERETWDVAVGWAWQLLAAPRWWRAIRGAVVTTTAVLVVAGTVNVMAAVDLPTALSGAATVCLPLGAGWNWRQVRHARAISRLAPLSRAVPVSRRRLLMRAAALVIAAGCAAITLTDGVARDRTAAATCPHFVLDAPVGVWWQRDGGQSSVGCPTGDSRVNVLGMRYTPWTSVTTGETTREDMVVYSGPATGPLAMPLPVFTTWVDTGGPRGALGEATDTGTDRTTWFVNFQRGSIELVAGRPPQVQIGQHSPVTHDPADPCVPRDRPCITTAYADVAGLHVGWQYGMADAFNIAWLPAGAPDDRAVSREVAGYRFSWPDPHLAGSYIVWVQACDKHFLARSTCTPFSARVIIRVR